MKKTLALVLCIITIASCQSTFHEAKETPSMTDRPKYSIEEVEKIAHIEIPDAASEIQVYVNTGWMDDAALIKFAIPPDELEPFLEKYGFTLEKGHWSVQNGPPSVDWWPSLDSKPPRENYLGGELYFYSSGYSQSILVDITNPDLYVVYFQYFEQ